MTRYIHVTDWDEYQHRDVTRNKSAAAAWIKDAPGQLNDPDYLELGFADRGLLQDIRRAYALNRGRGLNDSTSNLSRLLGQRVYRSQLERLNDAGYIHFSASKSPASCQQAAGLEEKRVEKTRTNPLAADAADEHDDGPDINLNAEPEQTFAGVTNKAADTTSAADGVARAARDVQSPRAHAGKTNGRTRDAVWDELEVLFGRVADRTSAHGKRNKAAADLRRHEATPELLRLAADRYRRQYPTAALTDTALAVHYPALTANARRPSAPPCADCGHGGGMHVVDCPQATATTRRATRGHAADTTGADTATAPHPRAHNVAARTGRGGSTTYHSHFSNLQALTGEGEE